MEAVVVFTGCIAVIFARAPLSAARQAGLVDEHDCCPKMSSGKLLDFPACYVKT